MEFPLARAHKPEESSELLTLQEVCARLEVHTSRVYVLVQEGKLHSLQRGGKGRKYYAAWEVDTIRNLYYVARVA